MGQREPEPGEVLALEAGLRALHERIAGRFRRPEAHQRALAYLQGLLGPVERKNGCQLAAYAGDATSDGVQRLLARYRWDEDGVRDDLREYVVEHLGDEQAVLVVDELGFFEAGQEVGGSAAAVQQDGGKGGELPDRVIPGLREQQEPDLSGSGVVPVRRLAVGPGTHERNGCARRHTDDRPPRQARVGTGHDWPCPGGWRALCLGGWGCGALR